MKKKNEEKTFSSAWDEKETSVLNHACVVGVSVQ